VLTAAGTSKKSQNKAYSFVLSALTGSEITLNDPIAKGQFQTITWGGRDTLRPGHKDNFYLASYRLKELFKHG